MPSFPSLLTFTHLIGLALGVGAATVKLTLLLKSKHDRAFLPVFIAADKPVTRLIIIGLALLTLSGVGWLLRGFPFTPLLIVKLVLVGAIWVLGPVIDNVVRPKFQELAPAPGESASQEFVQIQQRYLALEVIATGLFYVIVVIWILL
jgi:hypothetical protein